MNRKSVFISILFLLWSLNLTAATTGKIYGTVTEQATGGPCVGANIVINDTQMGAAADIEGRFIIINVPPGDYDLRISMIGYATQIIKDVRVEIDLTTKVAAELTIESIEGEVVEVIARKKVIKMDAGSSQQNIGNESIKEMPSSSLVDVVTMQAGVEGMSIRGGDTDESVMMLDGMQMKDDRTGAPITSIPLSGIKEVMIQSGGFNAEYGDLQSGVVSVVTNEGSKDKYDFNFNMKYKNPSPKTFDGSVYDADSYYLRPYTDEDVMWTGTSNGAWDSYTQNSYPAFEGWNEVSKNLLSDNDPTNDLSPMGAYRLFQWQHRRAGQIEKPDYNIDMGFGGPVPFISEKLGDLRFFASYYKNDVMYTIPLATDNYDDQSFTFRLTSNIGPKTKLQGNLFVNNVKGSDESNSGYTNFVSSSIYDLLDNFAGKTQTRSKIFYPHYFCVAEKQTKSLALKLTHTFSASSYGEASINYRDTKYNTYPSSIDNSTESGFSERDDSTMVMDILPGDSEYWVNEAPYGYEPGSIMSIDGFYMGVKGNSRDNSKTSNLQLKTSYTNQINMHNQIKTGAGVEFKKFDLDYGYETPFSSVWTNLSEKPNQMHAYIQDKIEYEGWVATIGVRAEYFNLNTDWYDVDRYDKNLFTQAFNDEYEKTVDRKKVDPKLYILPRLQVSHPITAKSKLYFNYGHMRQSVDPNHMFTVTRNSQNAVTYFGNPNIDFERTIQYELGFDQQIRNSYLLHIAGYYKDKMYQLNTSSVYESESTKGNLSYSTYENKLYQDIRGLEIQLSKTKGNWVTGFVNFDYRIASSGQFGINKIIKNQVDFEEALNNNYNKVQSRPLPRPRVKSNITFHTRKLENIVLKDWMLSLKTTWRAGAYTRYKPTITQKSWNVRWVDSKTFDLKLSRNVKITERLNLNIWADMYNVFNFRALSTVGIGGLTNYDWDKYLESLHFKKSVYDELGIDKFISGEDKIGMYKDPDIDFQPLVANPNIVDSDNVINPNFNAEEGVYYYIPDEENLSIILSNPGLANENLNNNEKYIEFIDGQYVAVSKSKINKVMDDKAYINMPNNSAFTFYNPRNIFIGLSLSFNF